MKDEKSPETTQSPREDNHGDISDNAGVGGVRDNVLGKKPQKDFSPDREALERLIEQREDRELKRTSQTIELVRYRYQGFGFDVIDLVEMPVSDFNEMLKTVYREDNRVFRENVIAAICGFDGKMAKKVLVNLKKSDDKLS